MRLIWLITGLAQSVVVQLAAIYFFVWKIAFLKGIVPITQLFNADIYAEARLFEPFAQIVGALFLYYLAKLVSNFANAYCNHQADCIALANFIERRA